MTSPTKRHQPHELQLDIRQGGLIACYAGSSTKRIRRRDLDNWISSLPERPQ